VEDALLVLAPPAAVPGLTVLASAAQRRKRVDAAHLQPDRGGRAETGRAREVEAAVPREQRRVTAVERDALAVDDEHRRARAVLRRTPHLLDFIRGAVPLHVRAFLQRARAGLAVDAPDSARR